MTSAVISVELPTPTLEDASRVAEQSGMSVADWIGVTVADRLREQRLTAEFYRRRALGGDSQTLLALLDKAPNAPPVAGDEIVGHLPSSGAVG